MTADFQGIGTVSRDPPGRWPVYSLLIGGVSFLALALLTLRSVSPTVDTAFQVGISHAPSLQEFFHEVVADNQAPAAQFVFWAAAQLGLPSVTAQRGVSLVLASLCYLAAIFAGTSIWRRTGVEQSQFAPTRAIILAAIMTILAPGVFPVSTFVRYSSFIGPVWLFVFILVERYRRGETTLAFAIGITTGLAFTVSYTAALLAISVAISILCSPAVWDQVALRKLALGGVIGLIPLVAWLTLANTSHIHHVFSRIDVAQAHLTGRALVGKTYELLAWMFVGPASLPTFAGLLVCAAFCVTSLSLIWIAMTRTSMHLLPLLAFTVLVIPFLFATSTATGWSMVGPAAVVAFVTGLGAGRVDRWVRTIGVSLIVSTAALASFPAANMLILRPSAFASRASQAAAVALERAKGGAALLVCMDWTTCLLTSGAVTPRSKSILDLDQLAGVPDKDLSPQVVLVFGDAGTSPASAAQEVTRNRLDKLRYTRVEAVLIAPYEAMMLRSRLGLNAQSAQYLVERWERSTADPTIANRLPATMPLVLP